VRPADLRASRANRVFRADEKRIRTENTVIVYTKSRAGGYAGSPIAHERKAVRAQSTIWQKDNPTLLLLLSITVFLVRIAFIRTKNTVGARSAQVLGI
jgi:hypothetical protein